MATIRVQVPDDIVVTARRSPDEVARAMRIALAVRWYGLGIVSQGKATEIAGMSRSEFIDTLGSFDTSVSQETIDDVRVALGRG
jgi:predicted HTH domain antitoxin